MEIQYLICGRKRTGLLPIIEETSTNIYFPSPFDTPNTTTNITTNNKKNAIYITGQHVSRVKDMLNKLSVQKVKPEKKQKKTVGLIFYIQLTIFEIIK
jgi:hypothetical protein